MKTFGFRVLFVQSLGHALASFPAPGHTAEDGGHVDWEGADFVIGDVCDTLRLMRAERSLLKCARRPVSYEHGQHCARTHTSAVTMLVMRTPCC